MHLSEVNQKYLFQISELYLLTFQELRILIQILIDFQMWQEKDLIHLWPLSEKIENKKQEKELRLKEITKIWNDFKSNPKSYERVTERKRAFDEDKMTFQESSKKDSDPILGKCPVASEKTLCCNLITLDAVNNCDEITAQGFF